VLQKRRAMKARVGCISVVCLALGVAACSKNRDAAALGAADTLAVSAPLADCGHAVCATNFFIDTVVADCAARSPCSMTVKLFATGEFHINDEYPYRFKADDTSGIAFLGTDAGGMNAFSKAAGDWQKSEEKSGAMTVNFSPAERGTKTIGGTFKLSVCSAQSCLLEQRQLTASVLTK
jgi:hypothetical protein